MVRVCNLCLEKLTKVDEDDDDDRRSVVSSVTSFPAHQFGNDPFTNLGHHPQSPFAASQLFGRTDEPFNLYSIAETRRPVYGSEGGISRPITPHLVERDDGVWEPIRENPAPFRRALSDEDNTGSSPHSNHEEPLSAIGSKTSIDFPTTASINVEGAMSSIQFPMGSPDHRDSPGPHSRTRPPFTSHGEFEPSTPFIRSRVHSRLDSVIEAEAGWRTRRESTAYVLDLS